MVRKNTPAQIVLFILVSAAAIASMSMDIAHREWLLFGMGLLILISNSIVMNNYRKSSSK